MNNGNKSPYEVLGVPLITERATILSSDEVNPQYVFRVGTGVNKIELAKAIEKVYKVKVVKVNTIRCKGKLKRQGRFVGHKSDWKKAFVSLAPGQKLDLI